MLTTGVQLRVSRNWGERIVRWTYYFQTGLLRQFAVAESVLGRMRVDREIQGIYDRPWYFPATKRPDWAAWSGILEIALKRMIVTWQNASKGDQWYSDSLGCQAGTENQPLVFFSKDMAHPTPYAIRIELTGFDRSLPNRMAHSAPRKAPHTWYLKPESVPWWCSDGNGRARGKPEEVPSAHQIWRWASGDETDQDREDLNKILGVEDGEKESTR